MFEYPFGGATGEKGRRGIKVLQKLKASAKLDFAMISTARYGKQAIPKSLVLDTWKELATNIIQQESGRSRARTEHAGVLVGSGLATTLRRLVQGANPSPTLH